LPVAGCLFPVQEKGKGKKKQTKTISLAEAAENAEGKDRIQDSGIRIQESGFRFLGFH
jgi:hypothetical protein